MGDDRYEEAAVNVPGHGFISQPPEWLAVEPLIDEMVELQPGFLGYLFWAELRGVRSGRRRHRLRRVDG